MKNMELTAENIGSIKLKTTIYTVLITVLISAVTATATYKITLSNNSKEIELKRLDGYETKYKNLLNQKKHQIQKLGKNFISDLKAF